MVTVLILLAAVGILVWGFIRARPDGKLGIFAWLQSVVLVLPWLTFFGLFSIGIYLNLAWVLILVLFSTGAYIYLGRQLRSLAEAAAPQKETEPGSESTQFHRPNGAEAAAAPIETAPADGDKNPDRKSVV